MSIVSKTKGKGTSSGWIKWLAVALVFGVMAFITSPNAPWGGFWGMQEASPEPIGVQKLLLMLLGAIQSTAFGFGVAFLIFGLPLVQVISPDNRGLGLAMYLAIGWSLISWWPHSNFHQTLRVGNISGLLAIEYAFHVTLILSGVIVAYFFLTKTRRARI